MNRHRPSTIGAALCAAWLTGCGANGAQSDATTPAADAFQADAASPTQDTSDVLDDDFEGCAEDIPGFEPGLRAVGDHLEAKLLTATPAQPERYLNEWTMALRMPDGSAASGAEITRAQTFMPIHGHDGRVQPEPVALAEPGHIELDRLNFTMRGPWEVRLWVQLESGEEDYLVFHVCVTR